MGVLACLQPRDRAEASRTVLLLTAVAGAVTVALALAAPAQAGGLGTAFFVVVPAVAMFVLTAWALTRAQAEAPVAWAAFPLAAVALMGGLDVATRDASTSAFVFFFFPVLYAGFQLPRRGAALVTGLAVVAVVVVALYLLPGRTGMVAMVCIPAVLITSAGVLVYTNERRASLLTQLRQQAAIDPLTGLATRRVLDQAATSVLRGAGHSVGTALLVIDIDHFKTVNDEFGHLAGDAVLVEMAAVLTAHARPDAVVSRMGGDEIAVLLPGCSLATAGVVGSDICTRVRAHSFDVSSASDPLDVTVSVGVAHAPTQADDLRSLYAAADAALYHAKRGGRDQAAMLPMVGSPLPRHDEAEREAEREADVA